MTAQLLLRSCNRHRALEDCPPVKLAVSHGQVGKEAANLGNEAGPTRGDPSKGDTAFDDRKCRIVEMRYFGGCTIEETAEALGISTITVIRDTRVAEAWLRDAGRLDPAS